MIYRRRQVRRSRWRRSNAPPRQLSGRCASTSSASATATPASSPRRAGLRAYALAGRELRRRAAQPRHPVRSLPPRQRPRAGGLRALCRAVRRQDAAVAKWVTDLKNRKPAQGNAPASEGAVMKFPTASLRARARAAVGTALAQGRRSRRRRRQRWRGSRPVQDRADIDRQQIIGNRELPKVLYIVPWKKPLPGDSPAAPAAACSTGARAHRPRRIPPPDQLRRAARPDPMPPPRRRAEPQSNQRAFTGVTHERVRVCRQVLPGQRRRHLTSASPSWRSVSRSPSSASSSSAAPAPRTASCRPRCCRCCKGGKFKGTCSASPRARTRAIGKIVTNGLSACRARRAARTSTTRWRKA